MVTYEMGQYTLASLLDKRSEQFSEKEAIVGYLQGDVVERLTYQELKKQSQAVAKGLIALGFGKGDHLILWLPNVNEWYVFEHACARIGVVMVPINSFLKTDELAYIMKQSDSKGIVYLKSFLNIPYQQMLEKLIPELSTNEAGTWQNKGFPEMRHVISLNDDVPKGSISLKELIEKGSTVSESEINEAFKAVNADDVHVIMYTSGTTGNPKGCMLSHKNILDSAWNFSGPLQLNENDRYLIPVPYFHIGGLTLGLMSALVRGATLISMDRFEAGKMLKILHEEKCTVTGAVPTIYIALLQHPDVGKYEYLLEKSFMAGAPCPVDTAKQVMDTFGMNMIIGLGQTETSPLITITLPDDPIDIRIGTVGKAMGTEIRVVDPVSCEDVPNGTPGELWVKGPNVMKGYYKMPEKTNEAFYDGWLRTGDMVVKNENNYINVVGRIKEMIIVGGENVYAREVEDFLRTHPKVQDAAYVGVPDQKYGEVGAAFVQLKEGEAMTSEEIINYCKGNMASFKVPRYVKFVKEYPLTPAGKIQKFRLSSQLIEELNLNEVASIKQA